MKLKAIVLALSAIPFATFAQGATLGNATQNTSATNTYFSNETPIKAGFGYSSDMEQTAPIACYNTTHSASGEQEILALSNAMSYSDFLKTVRSSFRGSGGIGSFSFKARAKFFRSLESKSYSMSLNYASVLYQNVNVQPAGYGLQALNSFGQSAYDNGQNKLFGIVCGDKYYDNYAQGAELFLAIKLQFNSESQKQTFEAKAKGGFGNIFKASAKIQKVATENHIAGNMELEAYQAGGDSTQLGKILNNAPDGKYYALTCNLDNLTACENAAQGLVTYGSATFPAQVSFTGSGKGLNPLGEGFASSVSISKVGLQVPASLVTPQIKQDRQTLGEELLENQYYQDKLGALVNHYPVAWDEQSNTYKSAGKYYNRAKNNVDTLLNPETGGLACYTEPQQCPTIYSNIQAELKPISYSNDLNGFLSKLKSEHIFNIVIPNGKGGANKSNGIIYPIGNGKWGFYDDPSLIIPGYCDVDITKIVTQPIITPTSFDATFDFRDHIYHGNIQGKYELTSTDGGKEYNGKVYGWWNTWSPIGPQPSSSNPYYFTAYSPTKQSKKH